MDNKSRKRYDDGMRLTQEVVEQLAAVLVRVEAVINVWLDTRIDMTVVEFAV